MIASMNGAELKGMIFWKLLLELVVLIIVDILCLFFIHYEKVYVGL